MNQKWKALRKCLSSPIPFLGVSPPPLSLRLGRVLPGFASLRLGSTESRLIRRPSSPLTRPTTYSSPASFQIPAKITSSLPFPLIPMSLIHDFMWHIARRSFYKKDYLFNLQTLSQPLSAQKLTTYMPCGKAAKSSVNSPLK